MLSTILVLLSLFLACLFGSGDQSWSWGPALLALSGAMIASAFERRDPACRGKTIVLAWLLPLVCGAYFIWRAWGSPVRDYAVADMLLVAAALAVYAWAVPQRATESAIRILLAGLAAIVALNFVVALVQIGNPGFTLFGKSPKTLYPSGLFTAYSYFANFMLGCGFLLLGSALFRRDGLFLRSFWGIGALMGFVSVLLSRSRGGLVALAVGGGVLLILLFPMLRKRTKRGFAMLILSLPVVLIIASAAGSRLLVSVQQARGFDPTAEAVLDNDSRLNFLGIAVDAVGGHPWLGGGSQSFHWEVYEFWDVEERGFVSGDPVYVHNEFMQALTDYGIVGVLGIAAVLGLVLLIGLGTVFLPPPEVRSEFQYERLPVLVGALAGLAAVLVQSGFSFVFHTLPSTLMFGLLAGLIVQCGARVSSSKTAAGRGWLARAGAAAFGLAMIPAGIRGARVTSIMLPVRGDDLEANLCRAIEIWPQSELFLMLGHDRFARGLKVHDVRQRKALMEGAITAYADASRLNPSDPGAVVNRARLLGEVGRSDESEAEFHRAIGLQGAFEAAFKGHHYFAEQLYRRGAALMRESKFREAKGFIGKAREQLAESGKLAKPHYFPPGVVRSMRLNTWRVDDFLTGYLVYKEGSDLWMQRKPEEALVRFRRAAGVLDKIRTVEWHRPPPDSPEARLLKDVRARIRFLEGAGIQAPKEE